MFISEIFLRVPLTRYPIASSVHQSTTSPASISSARIRSGGGRRPCWLGGAVVFDGSR